MLTSSDRELKAIAVIWYEECCEGGQTRCRVTIKVGERLSQYACGGLPMQCDVALMTVANQ